MDARSVVKVLEETVNVMKKACDSEVAKNEDENNEVLEEAFRKCMSIQEIE